MKNRVANVGYPVLLIIMRNINMQNASNQEKDNQRTRNKMFSFSKYLLYGSTLSIKDLLDDKKSKVIDERLVEIGNKLSDQAEKIEELKKSK
jgi:hypothetical protein